jgi:hypothetical protein
VDAALRMDLRKDVCMIHHHRQFYQLALTLRWGLRKDRS